MTANTDVHTCSYYCERPECIKRQRDELRDRMEAELASAPPSAPSDDLPTLLDNLMRASFDDGDRGREQFSGATMAAREAVLAHVRYASAPPSAAAGVYWPIIVEGLRLADRFFDGDDRYWKPASTVRAAYLAALAAQQQGGAE